MFLFQNFLADASIRDPGAGATITGELIGEVPTSSLGRAPPESNSFPIDFAGSRWISGICFY